MTDSKIQSLRGDIDRIDRQVVELLNRRARLAVRLGKHKRESRDGRSLCRPDREAHILRAVRKANKGPLTGEHVERIYRETISACLALEAEIQVAFLGPAGTFSHEAALAQFGSSAQYEPAESIADIVRAAEKSACDFGVVPVENSNEGTVGQTLDCMYAAPGQVQVCAERILRIRQHLLAHRKLRPDSVRHVYSHPQSLAQCRQWLRTNMPAAKLVGCSSNAAAAHKAARAAGASAAIGPQNAAGIYGLKVVARDIEDDPDNTTRFWVVGRSATHPTGRDKTSVAMTAHVNRAGGLLELLNPLAKQGVSMTKLESRPHHTGKMWEYVFFVDFEGHREDAHVAKALAQIGKRAGMLRVLGSYPAAD